MDLLEKWRARGERDLPHSVVAPFLNRIGWVKKGREALDHWAVHVLKAVPHFLLVYSIAVAVVVMLVFSQVWGGIRALGEALAPG